jgi:hypothetical protein
MAKSGCNCKGAKRQQKQRKEEGEQQDISAKVEPRVSQTSVTSDCSSGLSASNWAKWASNCERVKG